MIDSCPGAGDVEDETRTSGQIRANKISKSSRVMSEGHSGQRDGTHTG